jgi:hypothetical protein
MPKPQLKNIEEHLQFLVGQRNLFTKQDHLEKPPFQSSSDAHRHCVFFAIHITINPQRPLKS